MTESVNKVVSLNPKIEREEISSDQILTNSDNNQLGLLVPIGFYKHQILNEKQQDKLAIVLTKLMNNYGKNQYPSFLPKRQL